MAGRQVSGNGFERPDDGRSRPNPSGTWRTRSPAAAQAPPGLKKQVGVFVPLEDWKALRLYSAQKNVPMTDVCRQLLEPAFRKLRDGKDPLW